MYTNVSLTTGRDYNSYTKYEYIVTADAGETILERKGGFASNAAARRAGLKAADKFLADSLF